MAALTSLLPLLIGLLAGCGPDEPVLPGVPVEPLLADREPAAGHRDDHLVDAAVYSKPDGVLVDVRYLGGRSYREARDVLVEQLGQLLEVEDLPGQAGQRLRFERGLAQVHDDTIYMVRVPLPEARRRSQALEQLGFPPYVGRYVTLHREYRLNNTWGFRRIRLVRSSPDDELVTEIEAWHSVPGEPGPRR